MSGEFRHYHPIVNFIYFLIVFGFTMASMNPVILSISIFSAFVYSVMLSGGGTIKKNLSYMLPIVFFLAVSNPIFNHQGVTIIAYFPNGSPLTLEAVIYGVASAVMVSGIICWFSCYNFVMTSDKFIYLFGRLIPSMSLIFSMTLKLVPQFIRQIKIVADAQKTLGRDTSNGSIKKRIKSGISIISVMVTWSLERAVDTSDSMKSRGYGLFKRTSFAIYTFTIRDVIVLIGILLLSIYILAAFISGKIDFIYYPNIEGACITPYTISVYLACVLLYMMPVLIEIWEATRWKFLRRKI